MKDYVISEVTGKKYFVADVCRILNVRQMAFYLSKGVELLDVYPSVNKDNEPVLVFIVSRAGSYQAYKEWCDRKPN